MDTTTYASPTLLPTDGGATVSSCDVVVPAGGDWLASSDRDVTDPTPKGNKRKKTDVAPELSNLVVYTQAVKFRGLILTPAISAKHRKQMHASDQTWWPTAGQLLTTTQSSGAKIRHEADYELPSCCQVSSLNERAAKTMGRKYPSSFINHTERHLMRIYPAGMRIDSSNFNPIPMWASGIQLTALNYQTEDTWLHINAAMFEQNGRCGYALKPRVMWDKTHPLYNRFNLFDKDTFGSSNPAILTVVLISGQYVCPSNHNASPQVEVQLCGIPADCAKQKSKTISRNAVNPVWNDQFVFQVMFQELAFIRFCVTDTSSNHVTAQRVIPLKSLRPGYRHVQLRSSSNQTLDLSTLFICCELKDDSWPVHTPDVSVSAAATAEWRAPGTDPAGSGKKAASSRSSITTTVLRPRDDSLSITVDKETDVQRPTAAAATAVDTDAKKKQDHRIRRGLFMSSVRAIVAFRMISKSRRKPCSLPLRSRESKYSRKLGGSTFYEKVIPDASAPPESIGVTPKVQNGKAGQRTVADYCSMSLDRRHYRKNSRAARSGKRRTWQSFRASAGGGRAWNGTSTPKSENFWHHRGASLSFDDESTPAVKSPSLDDSSCTCSNDESLELSGLDGYSRSSERNLGLDVQSPSQPDKRSEDTRIGCSSAPVVSWSPMSDLDYNVGHAVAGSDSPPVVKARGTSDWRLPSRVKLKRYAGLSKTEAYDRRAVWAMKRSHRAGSVIAQSRERTLDRAVRNEDDVRRISDERSLSVDEPSTCSLACYQMDFSAETDISSHSEDDVDACLSEREGTSFISPGPPSSEVLDLMDDVSAVSGLSESSLLKEAEQWTGDQEVVQPLRLCNETHMSVHNLHCDHKDDGGTSPSAHSLSTDGHQSSVLSPVCDPFLDKPDTEISALIEDMLGDNEPSAVSRVDATSYRKSSLDVGALRGSDGDGLVCNSGAYRRSYEQDESKSEPAIVCSPGNVKYLTDLFERTASPSVIEATVETSPLSDALVDDSAVRGADERLGRDDEARQSVSSYHGRGVSSSSDREVDILTCKSPVIPQHISPMLRQPQNPTELSADSALSAKKDVDLSPFQDVDDDIGIVSNFETCQLRRTSSVGDDLQAHHFCIFTCGLDQETDTLPHHGTSKPDRPHVTRSYGDLLDEQLYDVLMTRNATQLVGVPQAESRNDAGVGRTQNSKPVVGPSCVSVIARHRPEHPRRTPRRRRTSGPTLTISAEKQTALLKYRTGRQVPGLQCRRLQTVEIARHKPTLF